jgi:hypothetical protein
MEGLNVLPQPPWYVGNNNKIHPPDANHLMSAVRYGYRGSRRIQQYETQPWEVPSKTRTEHTPAFLNNSDNYINEYVPPIFAAKLSSINGIETPKLWPENTEYTTGYPLKQYPSSWRYKRETTVDLPDRPKSPNTLSALMLKTQESNSLLKKYAKMESSKSHMSLPMAAQETFSKNWNATLKLNASASLKCILRRDKPLYEPHTLLDPSDTIKYSGSTAMIVHTQTTDELKFRLRMERSKSKSKTPFHLKWQHVIIHYNNVSKKLKRGYSMRKAIRSIAKHLRAAAMRNGSETSLRRIDFINACQEISFFDEVAPKQISLLYSLFDPMKRNVMRFVEFVGLLTALDMPELLPEEKIRSLWLVHYEFGLDRNIFDLVLEILTCCANSVADVNVIEKLFAEEFRAKCYEMSISGARNMNPPSRPGTSGTELLSPAVSTRQSTAKSSKNVSQALAPMDSDSEDEMGNTIDKSKKPGTAGSALSATGGSFKPKATGLSVQPQYNICEHYLDDNTLVQVLRQCPNLVAAFDQQLSQRLIACHGADDRYNAPEEEDVPVENQDFTWIMKKREMKKEVFGLF